MARSRARGDVALTVQPARLQSGEISNAVEAVTGKELPSARATSAPDVRKTVSTASASSPKDPHPSSSSSPSSPETAPPPAGLASASRSHPSASAPDVPSTNPAAHQQQQQQQTPIPTIRETKPSMDIDRTLEADLKDKDMAP
jgi:hypothetical protein